MPLTFKKILILLLVNNIHKMVDSKLTKMSDNRYVMPGRSCGILNPVKFLNELPKNEEDIQPCTIIDLTEKTRETSVKTPTTTTITSGVFRFVENSKSNRMYSVIHISTHPSKELCSKMALGEVGVSLT